MINKHKNRQLYCLHLLKKLDRKKKTLIEDRNNNYADIKKIINKTVHIYYHNNIHVYLELFCIIRSFAYSATSTRS